MKRQKIAAMFLVPTITVLFFCWMAHFLNTDFGDAKGVVVAAATLLDGMVLTIAGVFEEG